LFPSHVGFYTCNFLIPFEAIILFQNSGFISVLGFTTGLLGFTCFSGTNGGAGIKGRAGGGGGVGDMGERTLFSKTIESRGVAWGVGEGDVTVEFPGETTGVE
jgi:hypothetical protein